MFRECSDLESESGTVASLQRVLRFGYRKTVSTVLADKVQEVEV